VTHARIGFEDVALAAAKASTYAARSSGWTSACQLPWRTSASLTPKKCSYSPLTNSTLPVVSVTQMLTGTASASVRKRCSLWVSAAVRSTTRRSSSSLVVRSERSASLFWRASAATTRLDRAEMARNSCSMTWRWLCVVASLENGLSPVLV
jgi:hypothetical protein